MVLRAGDTPMSPSKVSPADFQVLKVVGQGAFGKVGFKHIAQWAPGKLLKCLVHTVRNAREFMGMCTQLLLRSWKTSVDVDLSYRWVPLCTVLNVLCCCGCRCSWCASGTPGASTQ